MHKLSHVCFCIWQYKTEILKFEKLFRIPFFNSWFQKNARLSTISDIIPGWHQWYYFFHFYSYPPSRWWLYRKNPTRRQSHVSIRLYIPEPTNHFGVGHKKITRSRSHNDSRVSFILNSIVTVIKLVWLTTAYLLTNLLLPHRVVLVTLQDDLSSSSHICGDEPAQY